MKFTEEQLRIAAKRADNRLFAQLPDEAACMDYTFSETFEQNMAQLIEQVKANKIAPVKVAMGWRYYTRNGLVAVLLCFMLSCIAMPDVVLAGYQKLVEVIETVVTEYTEYRYHSNETADAEFVPVTFGWLPEGMEEEKYSETENSAHFVLRNDSHYFRLDQRMITQSNEITYIVDTEDAELEKMYIGTEEVELILEEGVYSFVWLHEIYHLKGQSNLSSDEIMEILNNLKFMK